MAGGLCGDPFGADPNIEPLTGIAGACRRRSGDWRVSYVVDRPGRTIEMFEVRPRGSACR